MDMVELIKKMYEILESGDCNVDDIGENDYSEYIKHRQECIYCNIRETLNNAGEYFHEFNEKFKLVEGY